MTHAEQVREAVRRHIYTSRLETKAELARQLGIDRRTLDGVLSGRGTSRPTARLLAARGIPICGKCGRVECEGCRPTQPSEGCRPTQPSYMDDSWGDHETDQTYLLEEPE